MGAFGKMYFYGAVCLLRKSAALCRGEKVGLSVFSGGAQGAPKARVPARESAPAQNFARAGLKKICQITIFAQNFLRPPPSALLT